MRRPNERWEYRAETKGAAVEHLLALREAWPNSALTDEDVDFIIHAIEALDFSMPPPGQECVCDGFRWVVFVSFVHTSYHSVAAHAEPAQFWPEGSWKGSEHRVHVRREHLIYGIRRRTE